LEVVAELPQFLRRARVLKEHSIDVERIKFAGTEAIDGVADTSDKVTQLCDVVFRNHRTRRPALRLARHRSEVTHGLAPDSGN
jgi:hypothetical protein